MFDRLIEKLKDLTAPDRGLDLELQKLMNEWYGENKTLLNIYPAEGRCLKYTESIDAALTLAPEDADYFDLAFGSSKGSATATVAENDDYDLPSFWGAECAWDETDLPAVAICIAALRARVDRERVLISRLPTTPET